jgi:hypothetical protein
MTRQPRPHRGRLADSMRDTIDGISSWAVELEPEVREWLEGLDDQRWAQAMFHLDLLETRMRETAQIDRAAAAMARCQREGHTTDEGEEGRR